MDVEVVVGTTLVRTTRAQLWYTIWHRKFW